MLRTQSPQNSSPMNMALYELNQAEKSDLINSNEGIPSLAQGGQSRRQWRRRRLSRYTS